MESNNLDKDKNLEVQPESENIESNKNFVGKVTENKIIQTQPINNIMDLKKEIFDNRKFIRWTSFCSIFVAILIILSFFTYWLSYYFEYVWKVNWIINHEIYFNSQNCNRAMEINGVFYNVPDFIDKSYIFSCGWLIFFPLSIFLWCVGGVVLLISWVLNLKFLTKLKNFKKTYLPFFIFSFVVPFLTWLYCMGIMAFMKHNNKINYYEWLKEVKVKKYNKKQNNLKHFK